MTAAPAAPSRAHPSLAADITELRVIGTPSFAPIVDGVSLRVAPGEILGVVGESGSGKTTLGLALLNYARGSTAIQSGRVRVGEKDLATLSAREVRALRGRTVAYVPQSPASALNPALRIRTQLLECLSGEREENLARLTEVMAEVALPGDAEFLSRYPHQLSGGQQQRVAIAMAFIARPALIVLDEPTTGLDVSTQQHVLETVRELCTNSGSAAIYISHDLAVVADLSDRIAVLYAGRAVEQGPTAAVIATPAHPYTRLLLAATPVVTGTQRMRGIPGNAPSPLARPPGCAFAPRCPLADDACRSAQPEERPRPVAPGPHGPAPLAEHTGHRVRCFRAERSLPEPRDAGVAPLPRPEPDTPPSLSVRGLRAGFRRTEILHGIDLDLFPGECLALLGESGSGKTTLSSCLVGLHTELVGSLTFAGAPLNAGSYRRTAEQRQRIQYVFQNPYDSLNPRRTVRDLLAQPLMERRGRRKLSANERAARVAHALEQAMLRPDHAARFPEQLSGGERQRVAIARALMARPDILVCDEITSALDVSVQASIVELLARLQREQGLTLLFITHNIALVRNIAQRVAVLQHGTIVETQDTESLFANPRHAYTRSLIRATPDFSRSH